VVCRIGVDETLVLERSYYSDFSYSAIVADPVSLGTQPGRWLVETSRSWCLMLSNSDVYALESS